MSKHIILSALVFLLIGYFVGVKFPSFGSSALSKVGV